MRRANELAQTRHDSIAASMTTPVSDSDFSPANTLVAIAGTDGAAPPCTSNFSQLQNAFSIAIAYALLGRWLLPLPQMAWKASELVLSANFYSIFEAPKIQILLELAAIGEYVKKYC